ncbi:hypothetical protein K440DRAFT_605066 [Wilcoxina mikolae CBS 423.85]|nr:hypothetical protein K440DRAFT_605066 [Wilcoxina mikolae CBS 423.85]
MSSTQKYSLIAVTSGRADWFDCQWVLNTRNAGSEERLSRTFDLLLRKSDEPIPTTALPAAQLEGPSTSLHVYHGSGENGYTSRFEETELGIAVHDFLLECVEAARTSAVNGEHLAAVKFILPDADGYTVRADFLERRLDGCELVAKAKGFLSPLQAVKSAVFNHVGPQSFVALFSSAVGGILLKNALDHSPEEMFHMLDVELNNRISFPWISSERIPRKRLAWVEGRKDIEVSRRMYEAAWALGITLVVIDNPGHWLEDDKGPYAYLREAFIPVSIAVDEGFVERIVEAVRNYDKPIEAIMTVSDARLVGVAKACEMFGFPTSPSDSYDLAGDKYKTRMMELHNDQAFRVFSVTELRNRLNSNGQPTLQYPLIVKPCMGWGSECVSKVSNETELVKAVEKASTRHATSPQRRTDVLIEPYIDGPEVDANFVLLNKELVFYEIADDFPSRGDAPNANLDDHFQETANLFPVGLPQNEIIAIRDSIHKSILRQGFSTGTFHCEARLRYSSVHYTTENGHFDLYLKRGEIPAREVSVYLLEINARPAGYLESVAVHLTYGVDYFAQQLLFAIGDETRFRALANPFLRGPQYTLVLLLIPEERPGVMKSEDPGAELLERCPELRAHVPDYKTVMKRGDRLAGPTASELSYLAYFSVISRKGRRDCLELAEKIRREFRYELE